MLFFLRNNTGNKRGISTFNRYAEDCLLIIKLKKGDEEAYIELINRHYYYSVYKARQLYADPKLAKMLVQTTLYNVWDNRLRIPVEYTYPAARFQLYIKNEMLILADNWRTRENRRETSCG